jgi:PTH1 family peptidyl-tRNA hydrolase
MATIRLVAGLGNPGREHLVTRHNAGFWFADGLASRLGAAFRTEGRFHGQVAKAAGDLRLLKPATYMNLSGRSDFWRLRIGIGHPRDSAIPQQDVADYVLAPPSKDDLGAIEAAIDRALEAWPAVEAGEFERAMLLLHTKKEKP